MSDFMAKMYRIQFRPLGELTAISRLLAGFKGPTSKGGERKESGMGGVGNGTKWGKGGRGTPLSERYGLALAAFAAWRVDISNNSGRTIKYLSGSKVEVRYRENVSISRV